MKRVEEISRPYFALKKRVAKRTFDRKIVIDGMVGIVKRVEEIRKTAELNEDETDS